MVGTAQTRLCPPDALKDISRRGKIVDLSELFKRAYSEKITDAELAEVVRMIGSGEENDLYILTNSRQGRFAKISKTGGTIFTQCW
jgi:hypothetical protein